MSDGMRCKCAAWSANECSCPDVDWRSAREVELEAENKALRKDAERYRWLRDKSGNCDVGTVPTVRPLPSQCNDYWALCEEILDASIDAAMEKENDQ